MMFLNNKTIQVTMLSLIAGFLTIPNAIASNKAISGSQCQAKDESVLSAGSLIRSTFGITNKSNTLINVYCPVDASTEGNKIKVNIIYTVQESNFEVRSGSPIASNLDCKLAFNRKVTESAIEGKRLYNTFNRTKFEVIGVTSTTLRETETLTNDPVVIKCTLRAGDQIRSINSEKTN